MSKITEARVGVSIHGAYMAALSNAGVDAVEELESPTVRQIVGPLVRFCQNAARTLLAFENRASEIESDHRLSPEGRADVLRDAAAGALNEIGAESELPDLLSLTDRSAASIRASLNTPPPADDPNAISIAGDIRRHVAGMDAGARISFFQKHAGDPMTVHAVLSAPPYLSGLDDSTWNAFHQMAMHEQFPERAAAIDLIEKMKMAAGRAARNAESLIVQRSNIHRMPDGSWGHQYQAGGAPRLGR